MPNFDRTGPAGHGSRTGRQMGKCNPDNKEKDSDEITGRGPGKGLGKGPGKGLGKGLGRGR